MQLYSHPYLVKSVMLDLILCTSSMRALLAKNASPTSYRGGTNHGANDIHKEDNLYTSNHMITDRRESKLQTLCRCFLLNFFSNVNDIPYFLEKMPQLLIILVLLQCVF